MLGHPVAGVAEPLAELRQAHRLGERVGAGAAPPERRLVHDAQRQLFGSVHGGEPAA